ncbi:MAG: HAMP domain-containing protein [Elusimicrobiota bacterium]
MMNRRRKLMIEPRFQMQFMLQIAGWVTLATLITAVVACGVLAVMESRMAGDFFYITRAAGAHPRWFSLSQLILPALVISLPINLLLTLVFALYYSNRLAGPLHRLTQDILRLARGEKTRLDFALRDADEMQEVAHAFDALLKTLTEKGYLKEQ